MVYIKKFINYNNVNAKKKVEFKLEKKTVTLILQSERNGWQGPTKAYTQATIHYNADINPHVPDHFSCRIA